MKIVKQAIFDDFKCLANECDDTCCKGWEIDIDEESLKRFNSLDEPLKSKLANAIDFKKGIFKYNQQGVCNLLREDGLCSLVCECGEDFLCDICHTYPRHVEEYDGVREWSIALSCKEALRMILNVDSSEFIVANNDEPEEFYEDFEDFDYLLFTKLEDSRELLYKVIQNENINIFERMDICLEIARRLQARVDDNEIYAVDEIIDELYQCMEQNNLSKIHTDDYKFNDIKSLYEYFSKYFVLFSDMEVLREDWYEELDKLKNFLNKGQEYFINAYKEFYMADEKKYSKYLENILMSLVYTYYLGAVYDDCVYAKIGMSVFFTMYALLLSMVNNDKSFLDVYRLAREVEHSDKNLEILGDYFNNEV